MSRWTPTNVNGALADSLVTDFGGATAANIALAQDSELFLMWHYSSSAATQVQIFLATAAGAAGQNIIMLYDSALQLNPAANSTQWIPSQCVSIPLATGTQIPMQLRITKAASTAIIRWKTTPKAGGGC